MEMTRRESEEIVQGIVVPIAWGPAGEVLQVTLLTPDEGEYEVAPGRAGRLLVDFLREVVEARVVVHGGPKGRQTVTVLSFTVLAGFGRENEPVACEPLDDSGPPSPECV